MKITWKPTDPTANYSSLIGIDENATRYYQTANRELVTAMLPDGRSATDWTEEKALAAAKAKPERTAAQIKTRLEDLARQIHDSSLQAADATKTEKACEDRIKTLEARLATMTSRCLEAVTALDEARKQLDETNRKANLYKYNLDLVEAEAQALTGKALRLEMKLAALEADTPNLDTLTFTCEAWKKLAAVMPPHTWKPLADLKDDPNA